MSTRMIAVPNGDATSVGQVIEMSQIVIEERDAELASLRERLAYYDAFDTMINDNVARSAELFRTLSDERERMRADAERRLAEQETVALQETERRLTEERARVHATLMGLMNDASHMQRQIDGLIQRIAEAITETTVR